MRFILFAILVTVVYSWDEISGLIIRIASRKKSHGHRHQNADEFVATAVMFFAIPLSLIYFLASDSPLVLKLGLLAGQLLAVAVLSSAAQLFWHRAKEVQDYHGMEKVGAVAFALAGLVSPVMRTFGRAGRSNYSLIAKFAGLLALPALLGLAIAYISPKDILTGDVLPNTNALIMVAVGGLIIMVAAEVLEKHLKLRRIHAFAYVRVLLGIVILFTLGEGLI
jgi:hypothetical protein